MSQSKQFIDKLCMSFLQHIPMTSWTVQRYGSSMVWTDSNFTNNHRHRCIASDTSSCSPGCCAKSLRLDWFLALGQVLLPFGPSSMAAPTRLDVTGLPMGPGGYKTQSKDANITSSTVANTNRGLLASGSIHSTQTGAGGGAGGSRWGGEDVVVWGRRGSWPGAPSLLRNLSPRQQRRYSSVTDWTWRLTPARQVATQLGLGPFCGGSTAPLFCCPQHRGHPRPDIGPVAEVLSGAVGAGVAAVCFAQSPGHWPIAIWGGTGPGCPGSVAAGLGEGENTRPAPAPTVGGWSSADESVAWRVAAAEPPHQQRGGAGSGGVAGTRSGSAAGK